MRISLALRKAVDIEVDICGVNNLQLKQKASFQGITALIFYFMGYSVDF